MNELAKYCESCKTNTIENLLELDTDGLPYRLCNSCHHRLTNKALRPLEYFNLTAIHGHSYFLHDDFYENQTGEATQPKINVEDAYQFPFPKLSAILNDLDRLVDFAIVQYSTTDEIISLLASHDKASVLNSIDRKLNYNRAIDYKAYEIVAKVHGPFATDWVRLQWSKRKSSDLLIISEAVVKCLPTDEAFNLLTSEIEKADDKSFLDFSGALLHFQDSRTLNWIERNKNRIKNISTSWGVLAAASNFDWQTAKQWLISGRPLSIIALDALVYCTTKGARANQSLWLQKHPPKFHNADKLEVIAQEVDRYIQQDNVPRTKTAAKAIIDNLFATLDS